MSENQKPVVLIVDDEPELAELFATWLEDEWTVKTAYDGEAALDAGNEDVKIVLLDRRMPGLSGDAVLDSLRERGHDFSVVMVTAVDPDFDIIEMGFDDYLVKPVSRSELQEAVENIYQRMEYDSNVREYFSLVSKKSVLESEKSPRELDENTQYSELKQRLKEIKEKADTSIFEFESHEEYAGLFRGFSMDDAHTK